MGPKDRLGIVTFNNDAEIMQNMEFVNDTKGGIQLIKLKKNNNSDDNVNVELEVNFEDRNGRKYKNIQNVTFNPPKEKLESNDMIESDDKESEEMNINFY